MPDDDLVIFEHEYQADNFLKDLKRAHPALEPTYAMSKDNAEFLDIRLQSTNGKIVRGVHLKANFIINGSTQCLKPSKTI